MPNYGKIEQFNESEAKKARVDSQNVPQSKKKGVAKSSAKEAKNAPKSTKEAKSSTTTKAIKVILKKQKVTNVYS